MQKLNVIVEGTLLNPVPALPSLPPDGGTSPIPTDPPPSLPSRTPYFDIGDVTGTPGETVLVYVEGGCLHPISGFHIGGGVGLRPFIERDGYGKCKAVGATLGPYLTRHLRAEDGKIHETLDELGDHYFSRFQFMSWEETGGLPEEWWEFAVGFFSIEHEAGLAPVAIPSGTHLFTLQITILPSTPPGVYELTCKDEWYYLQSRPRRRDFTYTYAPQGFTKIETFGGKLTVRA